MHHECPAIVATPTHHCNQRQRCNLTPPCHLNRSGERTPVSFRPEARHLRAKVEKSGTRIKCKALQRKTSLDRPQACYAYAAAIPPSAPDPIPSFSVNPGLCTRRHPVIAAEARIQTLPCQHQRDIPNPFVSFQAQSRRSRDVVEESVTRITSKPCSAKRPRRRPLSSRPIAALIPRSSRPSAASGEISVPNRRLVPHSAPPHVIRSLSRTPIRDETAEPRPFRHPGPCSRPDPVIPAKAGIQTLPSPTAT